jgi:hypothetical protein
MLSFSFKDISISSSPIIRLKFVDVITDMINESIDVDKGLNLKKGVYIVLPKTFLDNPKKDE